LFINHDLAFVNRSDDPACACASELRHAVSYKSSLVCFERAFSCSLLESLSQTAHGHVMLETWVHVSSDGKTGFIVCVCVREREREREREGGREGGNPFPGNKF
jgi:hypothetical protein